MLFRFVGIGLVVVPMPSEVHRLRLDHDLLSTMRSFDQHSASTDRPTASPTLTAPDA